MKKTIAIIFLGLSNFDVLCLMNYGLVSSAFTLRWNPSSCYKN